MSNWQSRPRSKMYHVLCEWCGVKTNTSRTDRLTCSGKCRQRLAKYVLELGWYPDKPPGEITAQNAIDLVLLELVIRERKRREGDQLLRARTRAGKLST